MKDKIALETTIKWIQDPSKGVMGRRVESLTLEAIQLVEARNGFVRCNFIVPTHLADKDGNWHAGAMATLIDSLGTATAFSFSGNVKASLDFSLSFYSTVKILEEVEIEAKVVQRKGKLTSVEVKVKRKDSGQLIALGKLWTTSSQGSKL
ncbi:hypothetical protein Pint_01121 [Pistacia integerrima]|uniref:Uncharacterized protein n=1 Tax=Pistacia integerrima TaxID=434235 RepID=A0ACC0ZII3_9ROSI|nr:hypothetical protein Pint_01121 [Pistacia integerrima]